MPLAEMYLDQIIRSVVADRPAMCYPVNKPLALEDLCPCWPMPPRPSACCAPRAGARSA